MTVNTQSVQKTSKLTIVEIQPSNTKLPGKRPSMASDLNYFMIHSIKTLGPPLQIFFHLIIFQNPMKIFRIKVNILSVYTDFATDAKHISMKNMLR